MELYSNQFEINPNGNRSMLDTLFTNMNQAAQHK